MKIPWMNLTLREFQAALASSSPTPGGGTAAAVALGQAAALTIMVGDLTIAKEKWQSGWEIANQAVALSIGIMTEAGSLADKDSDSFDAVMNSFRMPKETDNEKEARMLEIHATTLVAAQIPFETAKLALELIKLLPDLAKLGNTNAISDVGVAGLLASAACKGALFNVNINLSSLPDNLGGEIRKQSPLILEECRELSRSLMKIVNELTN